MWIRSQYYAATGKPYRSNHFIPETMVLRGHTSAGYVAAPARFGGRLGELLKPGAAGVKAHAQHGDQGGDHALEAAPVGQDHAEAVEGQDGGVGPRELGKGRANLIGPTV
jgi:hypothetical protein